MSVNSKLTALADEVRELSGVTGTMGLDAMATNIGDANTEVDTQADLIEQILAALDAKFGEKVTMITFTINDVEYQAEEGMTWVEWCASDYNEDKSYYVDYDCDGILSIDMQVIVEVIPTDTIIDGHDYFSWPLD